MTDWLGLGFIIVLIAGALFGLRALSKERVSTSDEFERRASEEKTMLGSAVNALQDFTDPANIRAKEVIEQMKDGTYRKKKREGKAGGNLEEEGSEISEI